MVSSAKWNCIGSLEPHREIEPYKRTNDNPAFFFGTQRKVTIAKPPKTKDGVETGSECGNRNHRYRSLSLHSSNTNIQDSVTWVECMPD